MIVTPRARWIIMLAILAAMIGIFRQQATVVCLSLTCLVWIWLEWLAFRYRVDFYLRTSQISREVRDRQGPARVLWEERTAEVVTSIQFKRLWLLPSVFADVRDLLPPSAEQQGGENGREFSLGSAREIHFTYQIRPRCVGTLKFVGLRFAFRDLHGFFGAERFLHLPQRYRVLPLATDTGIVVGTRKRSNSLSPPGIHLLPRSGAGSELLEIREYVPGDAPRSIAWKVSARRDELMSKQFESEVPVRCQLLVDLSRSVRLGYPGRCQAGRLVSLAATIAHNLAAHRDPVGISIIDGANVVVEKPSANRKAILRMVDRLCVAIDKPIEPVATPSQSLIRAALDVARIRYPQVLENAPSGYSRCWPTRPSRHKRFRISAVICNHYELDSFALADMVENDLVMSRWLQRFLADHQTPFTGSLFDAKGNYLFADGEKIGRMAKLIQRAVLHGCDNELFVIMAALTDNEYKLEPLIKAIKVAKARHHRVMVLCAWSPGTPEPSASAGDQFDAIAESIEASAATAEWRLQNQAFHRLRGELAKLRVPVVPASDRRASRLILNQLELIRAGRWVA